MQSNPVCSALGAQRSHFAPIFAIVNVISGFKCELHLSPIHALCSSLPLSHIFPCLCLGRVCCMSKYLATLTRRNSGIDCGSAAESWPIKWAAVSEARRWSASVSAHSKRFESQLQYFLVLALTVELPPHLRSVAALPSLPPTVSPDVAAPCFSVYVVN